LALWTRRRTLSARRAEGARIVLAVADGAALRRGPAGGDLATQGDQVTRPVSRARLAGLEDEEWSGRPKSVDDAAIIAARLDPPPPRLGVTHWSSRLLAHIWASAMTMAGAWHKYGVKPWRRETFKSSTDPELEGKVRDMVGLYLNPPEKAVVLCVDEKCQTQALNPNYKRNGTTTLFAALEVATGKVTDEYYDRHGKAALLNCLKKVARASPRREQHVALDNYHTHKHDDINCWLAKNPESRCTSPRTAAPG
jgi:hypothetical protein